MYTTYILDSHVSCQGVLISDRRMFISPGIGVQDTETQPWRPLFRCNSPQGLCYGKSGNKDQSPLCRAIIRREPLFPAVGCRNGRPWWVDRGVETTSALPPPQPWKGREKKGTWACWAILKIVSLLGDLHWYWGTDHLLVMQFD